jgi:hypothetical protein
VFVADNGWKVEVMTTQSGSYHDIEQALVQALDEVRHYIACGMRLF